MAWEYTEWVAQRADGLLKWHGSMDRAIQAAEANASTAAGDKTKRRWSDVAAYLRDTPRPTFHGVMVAGARQASRDVDPARSARVHAYVAKRACR